MIVKDESKVILRCLKSVINYIDTYCICDTGSSDQTIKMISDFFQEKGIKGKILNHQWKNFGHNRTLAVQESKNMADYLLLMDADFVFKALNPRFKEEKRELGCYLIKYEGALDYRQPLLVRADLNWKYIGVTHEYVHCPDDLSRANCDDFIFEHFGDGANKEDKFIRDINLLTEGLIEEPNNSRYYFYLAQSHKDLGCELKQKYTSKVQILGRMNTGVVNPIIDKIKSEVEILSKEYHDHLWKAIEAYEKRITFPDFPEEVYYATYMLGFCHYHLESQPHIFTGYFMQASAYRPGRLEALYNLVKYWRIKEKYQIAYDLGSRAAIQPYPSGDCLFIDIRTHTYTFKHEVAIASYYLGKFQECQELLEECLRVDDILPNHRKQIEAHLKMTLNKLQEKKRHLEKPLVTFFSYNVLGQGGSEISDWGLVRYLAQESGYSTKHSRDYREIIQDQPNLILAQQYAIEKGVKMGKELDIPVIVTQHGPDQWGHGFNSCYFIFNSYTLCESETVKAKFNAYDVVYPCIDVNKFKKVNSIGNNGQGWDRLYITFIGRPIKEKGIETFLKIATTMPEHDFLFVGGNPEGETDVIIPDNVEIREFTNKAEEIYAQSRIVLMPSLSEPFGMVAIEASLVGIPVICSELPGIFEATSGLSNYVSDYENVDQWTKKIKNVLHDYPNQCYVANKIGNKYIEKSTKQLTKFKYNVSNLLEGREVCKYTRGIVFSITITVFNRSQLVIRAIESVINQIGDVSWEIVVVDDCSTDNTWDKLCQYMEENPSYHMKLIQNDVNSGTFYCRNVGIKEASGDFILNLDSDDVLIPSCLSQLQETIWKNNAKIVQFKYYRDINQKLNGKSNDLDFDSVDFNSFELDLLIDDNASSWGLFCFEKEYMVSKVGYYDTLKYGADTEFMCRLKNFHPIVNLNQIVYLAADLPGSLSKQISKEWSNQHLRNFMKWYEKCKKKGEKPYFDFPCQERPFRKPKII